MNATWASPRIVGAALAATLALATPATAADVCDTTPCRITLDFSSGGGISSGSGATITFGTGGSLVLGTGGAIDVGEGGSVVPAPAEGSDPDMSGGGSVTLGPGGSITFGTGGSLATASAGGISFADGSDVAIAGARAISIESDGSVRLGQISSSGSITVRAAGTVDTAGSIPASLSTANDDAAATIEVTSGGDVSYASISSENISITEGASDQPGGGFGTGGAPAGSALQAPPSSGSLAPGFLLIMAWSGLGRAVLDALFRKRRIWR